MCYDLKKIIQLVRKTTQSEKVFLEGFSGLKNEKKVTTTVGLDSPNLNHP